MSTFINVIACQCRTCARSKKVASQRGAAEHVGMSVKDFREACRNGNGPRVFGPTEHRPRYAISVLDQWVFDRDDARGAA